MTHVVVGSSQEEKAASFSKADLFITPKGANMTELAVKESKDVGGAKQVGSDAGDSGCFTWWIEQESSIWVRKNILNYSMNIRFPVCFRALGKCFEGPEKTICCFTADYPGDTMFYWMDFGQVVLFKNFILACILINCITLAIEVDVDPNGGTAALIKSLEIIFTVVFTIEIVVKIWGLGLCGQYIPPDLTREEKLKIQSETGARMFQAQKDAKAGKTTTQVSDASNLREDFFLAYFSDPWNLLDFLIVVGGSYVPIFVGGGGDTNVSSIRALRTLRPLRTLNHFPQLKISVMALLNSMEGLNYVFFLCMFVFLVYGIMAINLFKNYDFPMFDKQVPFPKTLSETACLRTGSGAEDPCVVPNNEVSTMTSFHSIGISIVTVFRVITMESWTPILAELTQRYDYRADLFFVTLIFFGSFYALNLVPAVIVSKYCVVYNLVTAEGDQAALEEDLVSMMAQREHGGRGVIKRKKNIASQMRVLKETMAKVNKFDRQCVVEENKTEDDSFGFDNLRQDAMKTDGMSAAEALKALMGDDDDLAENTEGDKSGKGDIPNLPEDQPDEEEDDEEEFEDFDGDDQKMAPEENAIEDKKMSEKARMQELSDSFAPTIASGLVEITKPIQNEWLVGWNDSPLGGIVYNFNVISRADWFNKFVMIIIMANTVTLAMEYKGQTRFPVILGAEESNILESVNMSFTIFFIIEMIIKLIGLGYSEYTDDGFNCFDAFVVMISVFELMMEALEIDMGNAGALTAFRAFRSMRLLRVFRILGRIRSLRTVLNSVLEAFSHLVWLLAIVFIFLFMFSVLGVSLFGDCTEGKEFYENVKSYGSHLCGERNDHLWTFKSFPWALVTVFQVMTGDAWPYIFEDSERSTSQLAAFYFIGAVVVGKYIIFNLFVAILLARMSSQDENQWMLEDFCTVAENFFEERDYLNKDREERDNLEAEMKKRLGEMAVEMRESRKGEYATQLAAEMLRAQGHQMSDQALLGKDNPLRILLFNISHNWLTEWIITILIIMSCVTLAYEQPLGFTTAAELDTLELTDWIFTIIFLFEMIGRILADGFWGSEWSYMGDPWNWLDGVVVVGSLLGLAFPSLTIIRVLRAFRPLRIAVRFEEVRVVIIAIGSALPALFNTAIFCLLFWLVLSILGVHLFADKYPAEVIRGRELSSAEISNPSHAVYSAPFGLYANTSRVHNPTTGMAGSLLSGGTQGGGTAAVNNLAGMAACTAMGGSCRGYTEQEIKCDGVWETSSVKCKTWSGVKAPKGWTKETGCPQATAVWKPKWTPNRHGGVCEGFCFKYRKGMSYYPKKGTGEGTGTIPGMGPDNTLGREPVSKLITTTWEQQYLCAEALCEVPLQTCLGDVVCERNKVHESCATNNFNFNNVFKSTITLYKLGQMTSWYQELYTGVRATGDFAVVFFVMVVLICGFFTLNLIIAVVVDNFDRMGKGKEYSALLTKTQAINIRSTRLRDMFPLIVNEEPPETEGDCLQGVRKMVWYAINKRVPEPNDNDVKGAPLFDNFIMVCIALNAFFMCTSSNTQTPGWTDTLFSLDKMFTVIYTIEATLKIFANWTSNNGFTVENPCDIKPDGGRECKYSYDFWNVPPLKWWTDGWQLYWRDNWNKFDFIVVAASLPGLFESSGGGGAAPTATVRLLRLCRLVKVIQRAPMMRACFATLTYALPSMVNIAVLLFIVFYIWSVLGIAVFGVPKSEWPFEAAVSGTQSAFETDAFKSITANCYNSIEGNKLTYSTYLQTFNFNSFKNALIINWRIATNDEWESVYCWTSKRNPELTVFYFTSFGMFGTYLMANLFIAVMLMTLRDNLKTEESRPDLEYAGLKQWVDEWKKQDPNGLGYISGKQFQKTLKESPVLIGTLLGKLDLRPDATVEAEAALGDFFNEIDPDLDERRIVTDSHLKKIFLSNKFHIKMIKYGINTPRECNRVYYDNAIYAISGIVTGSMNIQPPLSPGEMKKPKHKRTEIRIAAWMKQADLGNMGADDDDVQEEVPTDVNA